MILLTNGDSWTQGDSPAQTINWNATKNEDWYDIVPNFGRIDKNDISLNYEKKILYKFYDSSVWPKIVGKKMGVETWNAGRLGSDNYDISISTIRSVEWLLSKQKEDIFVIVGWSSPLRVPMFSRDSNNPKKGYSIDQIRPYTKFNNFDINLFFNTYQVNDMYFFNIYVLQTYLKEKNINYLFFNAFDYPREHSNFYNLIDTDKWVDNTFDKDHFNQYIEKNYNSNFKKNDDYFMTLHPTDLAHTIWGNYLYSYLKNNRDYFYNKL